MENNEAFDLIVKSLESKCLQDCEPEWDNCRHREATYWLGLLVQQVENRANL